MWKDEKYLPLIKNMFFVYNYINMDQEQNINLEDGHDRNKLEISYLQ